MLTKIYQVENNNEDKEIIPLFYFWLCWVFVAACGLSLIAMIGSYFLAVHRLLTVMNSLVVEHRL